MKNIKSTLALAGVLGLGCILAAGQPVRAADTTDGPAAGHQKGERRGGGPLVKILKQLDLTDAQKEQVKPIMKDHAEQLKALRNDTTTARKDKREKMKAIMEATVGKIRVILTADQAKKFDDLLAQAKTHRRGDK